MPKPAANANANQVLQLETPAAAAAATRSGSKKCKLKNLVSTLAICCALALIIGAIYMHLRQKHHLGRLNVEHREQPAEVVDIAATIAARSAYQSEQCLACIAAAATANKRVMCRDEPCGIYRISRGYWRDAQLAVPELALQGYDNCVIEDECAARAVSGYLQVYAHDCNGDGLISCKDYIMLHLLGPTACKKQQQLGAMHSQRAQLCLLQHQLE
ncbi:CG14823 [Drosophila busckii]|uniref:lysozyme n=1 Tax=Drosophila busckii TaxID=30019 RepID=A0A0M4F199_DROBS|nr:invertebrate-type lysozyme 2 [Drosophila busckii]ALC45075.1 CG14823 [Drosophila busckii]